MDGLGFNELGQKYPQMINKWVWVNLLDAQ